MARRGNITQFFRGARRHPKWDLGKPPKSGWKRRRRDPRFFLKTVIVLVFFGALGLPYLADGVSALVAPRAESGCRVLSVTDGDTVELYCPGRGLERARLTGFDTPEIFSPGCVSEYVKGQQAAWALRAMIFGADEISVVRRGTDKYDRTLVYMAVDGNAVAEKMISAGHARPYGGGKRASWCG